MVLSIDMAPTLLDLAGVKVRSDIQGKSLVPIIKDESQPWRHSILIEYYSDTVFERIVKMGYKAVRNERYKYIHYVDLDGMDELYDLQEDPYELNNLINDPESNNLLESMKQELNERLRETGGSLD